LKATATHAETTATPQATAGATPQPGGRERRSERRSKIAPANRDFSDLKKIIVEESLLEKQTGFYIYKFALTFGLLFLGLALILLIENPWLQMLNAVFMGFASSQVSFLGHDAGHRQIARTAKGNDYIGYFVGNLVSGASFSWWLDDHNRHHAHTNDLQDDPNCDYPVLAFDREQFAGRKPWQLWIIKHQKYFFFPILSLSGINLKAGSIKFMLENKFPSRGFEAFLIAIHYVCYFGTLGWALGWLALPFIVVHQFSLGLFLGSVFAPNHKGMPLMTAEERKDFLRSQVLSSRNVKAHPVTDFMFGGLNYQIEHHLFPSVPRNKMRKLQSVVKGFCNERAVSYHETSTLGSYKEITDYLHEVSAPLREKPSAKAAEKPAEQHKHLEPQTE
jgi:fatty acid desaturase